MLAELVINCLVTLLKENSLVENFQSRKPLGVRITLSCHNTICFHLPQIIPNLYLYFVFFETQ